MYGKKNVIEAMLEGETEEMKEMRRSELANMDEAGFNDMAKQAGFDRIGNHWVGVKITSGEDKSIKTEPKPSNNQPKGFGFTRPNPKDFASDQDYANAMEQFHNKRNEYLILNSKRT